MTPGQKEHIQYLLIQYLEGTISTREEEQLFQHIEAETNHEDLQELLEELMAAEQGVIINHKEYQPIVDAILGKKKGKLVTMRRRWVRWVAAALVVGVLATAAITVISNRWAAKPGTIGEKSPAVADVPAPTNTRAVITLADGSKVYLDSVGNGTIAQENNVNVVKNANGGIEYLSPAGGGDLRNSPNNERPGVVTYNTLFNPRGSKVISLTFSDGTKVWLNAESSLRYPASFASAAVREVEITGEAYFEVKHNFRQPFKVHLPNGSVVEDIGTAFNVNAYSDEEAIKTTLVEGSIRLSPAGGGDLRNSPNNKRPGVDHGVILKPGEQAIATGNSLLTTRPDDLDDVTAWKNGRFSYNGVDMKTIMRDAARWYDVDVVFDEDVNEKFYADVPRNTNISTLLKMLEITKAVHFKVEGKKITVMK